MNRPAMSQHVRSNPNTQINPGGPNNSRPNLNNAQGFSGVNRSNNSVSSNRNVNGSSGFNSGNGYGGSGYGYGGSGFGYGGYGNGYGGSGFGYGGYGGGYGGYGNGLAGYVRVYIPGLGWVLVPRQALRGSLRGMIW
jgi:hypothetical protein